MKNNFITAIRLTLVCIFFFMIVYPLMVYGLARFAPGEGRGEVVVTNNKRTGFRHLGQLFTADHYFQGRPSAVQYNAAGSGGSNKGPSNPAYLQDVQNRIDSFMAHNPGVRKGDIPSDLVTASGSGLDPDISVAAARVQVNRIATSRGLPAQQLLNLIAQHATQPVAGIWGIEKVNVLQLNLALDESDK